MLTISQVENADQITAAQELIREYISWWAGTGLGDFKQSGAFNKIDKEIATLPGVYAPPKGRLLLAIQDELSAGCVCLKPQDSNTAELKRLYVRPAFRGFNIGQQLVDRVVAEAYQCGYQRVILDTHISMTQAHAIYKSAGFHLIDPPEDYPENLKSTILFMECNLS
jgi:putative acetyltransferase